MTYLLILLDNSDWLKDNIGWLKDLFTILFAGTATVLAILTYRRARYTILQPKRVEALKRQMEALTKFYSLISKNNHSIDEGLDYTNIFGCNVDLILRDYSLIDIDKNSEVYATYNQEIGGWIQFLEDDISTYVIVKGNLENYDSLFWEANSFARKDHYKQQAEQGNFAAHRIFLTKKHVIFYSGIKELANNPFLPEDIQQIAYNIGEKIFTSLHVDLRAILKMLAEKYADALKNPDSEDRIILIPEYRHERLWRIFESERLKHREDFELLKKKVRSHLAIDNKW